MSAKAGLALAAGLVVGGGVAYLLHRFRIITSAVVTAPEATPGVVYR